MEESIRPFNCVDVSAWLVFLLEAHYLSMTSGEQRRRPFTHSLSHLLLAGHPHPPTTPPFPDSGPFLSFLALSYPILSQLLLLLKKNTFTSSIAVVNKLLATKPPTPQILSPNGNISIVSRATAVFVFPISGQARRARRVFAPTSRTFLGTKTRETTRAWETIRFRAFLLQSYIYIYI